MQQLHRKRITHVLAALVTAVLLTASLMPAADAQETVVSETENNSGFVYWEDGFLVMTYSAADVCAGGPPPTELGTTKEGRDGTSTQKLNVVVPVSVYEIPDFDPVRIDLVFAWINENCETEAYAQGDARLRSLWRVGDSGVIRSRNRVRGTLTTADGAEVRVRTFASLTLDAATGGLIQLDTLSVNIR